MRVLVTGATGFIGARVVRELHASGYSPIITTRARAQTGRALFLDLTDLRSIARVLDEARPQGVIHLAAMRDLAQCEREPDLARVVNTDSVRAIAQWCESNRSLLVFASTDQVFDGLRGMYAEEDPPSPRNVYGRSKADAEADVLSRAHRTGRVARIALTLGHSIEGNRAPNEFVVNLLRAGKAAPMYVNEYRNPIHVHDVASALVELLAPNAPAILHLGGPDRVNRLEMGLAIARAFSLPEHLLVPTSYKPAQGEVYRSPDTSFDTTLARQVLRTPPRSLQETLLDLTRTHL